MSFFRLPSFISGKARDDPAAGTASDTRPTLSLHVPTFGGVMMKPLSDPSIGAVNTPTILAGQVELHQPAAIGLMCSGISVWFEGRWTDVEAGKDKGTSICYRQEAEVDCPEGGQVWLQPGRQRLRFSIALPPTLPRNSRTPTGRLLYWLVGTIEGLPDGKNRPKTDIPPSSSDNVVLASVPSSSINSSATSALPLYSHVGSNFSDVEWLRGSVQSERRIAISHNPNPEGGVTRLEDDFTHNLPEFGTCRIQTRVNEWCTGCLFPSRFTCSALSPLATLFAIRVRLEETVTITPPSTGRPTITKQSFTVVEQGKIPQPLSSHPQTDFPTLWRGVQAGGSDRGDFMNDTIGKLPVCGYDQSLPSTLPGMYMPQVGVPVRVSHKLVYEIYFSVFGKNGSGAQMPIPGQGGLQVMRRSLDTIVPQCVFVSEVLNLPSYSTVFGENIHRTDQYFYHRIEANLPCPTCHTVPLDNLCATCPGDIAVHVQHSMPLPRVSMGEVSSGKPKGVPPPTFDPACESCPTCSGQSVLPAQDPNFHLCGCEIEGREAAYHVVWEEPVPTILKVRES